MRDRDRGGEGGRVILSQSDKHKGYVSLGYLQS